MPERRKIGRQAPHSVPLRVIGRQQVGPLQDGMLVLQDLERLEPCVPTGLQRPGDRAVLGLDGIVLTLCALGFVASTLDAQLPMTVEVAAFPFHEGECFQHRPQRRRLHGLEKHGPDRRVEMADRKGLAGRGRAIELRAPALVAAVLPPVADRHAPSARPAQHQALQ